MWLSNQSFQKHCLKLLIDIAITFIVQFSLRCRPCQSPITSIELIINSMINDVFCVLVLWKKFHTNRSMKTQYQDERIQLKSHCHSFLGRYHSSLTYILIQNCTEDSWEFRRWVSRNLKFLHSWDIDNNYKAKMMFDLQSSHTTLIRCWIDGDDQGLPRCTHTQTFSSIAPTIVLFYGGRHLWLALYFHCFDIEFVIIAIGCRWYWLFSMNSHLYIIQCTSRQFIIESLLIKA